MLNIFFCTTNQAKLNELRQVLAKRANIIGLLDIMPHMQKQYVEPQEDANYFLCNAAIKLFSAIKFVLTFNIKDIDEIMVDDSGLCVPKLNFAPGVHSAYFAGLPRNDMQNNLLLQEKIAKSSNSISFKDEKRLDAFFICFLLSISCKNIKDLSLIKELELRQATQLNNQQELENNLLNSIDLKIPAAYVHKKICIADFLSLLPQNIFIDLNFGFCAGEVSTHSQNGSSDASHGYDPLFYSLSCREKSFANMSVQEKNMISHRAFAMKAKIESF